MRSPHGRYPVHQPQLQYQSTASDSTWLMAICQSPCQNETLLLCPQLSIRLSSFRDIPLTDKNTAGSWRNQTGCFQTVWLWHLLTCCCSHNSWMQLWDIDIMRQNTSSVLIQKSWGLWFLVLMGWRNNGFERRCVLSLVSPSSQHTAWHTAHTCSVSKVVNLKALKTDKYALLLNQRCFLWIM